jgi:hypothetical protein
MNEPLGLKEYMSDLLDFSYRGKKMKNMDEYGELSKASLAQVEKNYGEILGALWIASKESGKLMFPGAGNYPLIDFLFMSKDETTKYSSKGGSGKSTNVISTVHIIKYIDSNPEYDVYKKGKYKEVYDILNIIKDSSIKAAPKVLADYFKVKYDEKEIDSDNVAWYNLSALLLKKINTKENLDAINEIVNAILNVDYLITVLIKNPLKPDFIVKPASEINVAFRDKNSTKRHADKIGLGVINK